jgi:hypothetical protein
MDAVTRELEYGKARRQALVHKYSDIRAPPSHGSRAATIAAASRGRNPRGALHGGRGRAADAWSRAVGGTRSPPPPLPSPPLPPGGEGEGGGEGESGPGGVEEGQSSGDVFDATAAGEQLEALLPVTADALVVAEEDGFAVSRVDPWARNP